MLGRKQVRHPAHLLPGALQRVVLVEDGRALLDVELEDVTGGQCSPKPGPMAMMPPVEVPAIEVSPYRIFKMLLNTGQRSSRKDARIQPPSSDGSGNSFASTLLLQRIALRTRSNEHSVQTRGCGESEPKCSRALSAIVEKAPLLSTHAFLKAGYPSGAAKTVGELRKATAWPRI
jgi:hypothetical protein